MDENCVTVLMSIFQLPGIWDAELTNSFIHFIHYIGMQHTLHFKQQIALRYAELVYFGKWFTTLREALQLFISKTQESIDGWVRLKLYKGNVVVLGRQSPNSLYREDFATFGQDDVYDQADAKGFIELFSLQMKVQAMMDVNNGGKTRYKSPDYSIFKRD